MPRQVRVEGMLTQVGASTRLPLPRESTVGLGGRYVPARVTIGGVTAVVTLHREGGTYAAALPRSLRDATGGAGHGARVVATVEILDEPPPVDVPADLAAALTAQPRAAEVFQSLTPGHRRHIVDWITEARRVETRARRITQLVDRLPGMRRSAGWTER
jgi:Bacteriocin-protection, YdeI or OmpD-Associated